MNRFHCAALAAAAFLGTASVASGADLPVKAPAYKMPLAASAYNWTGFYIGGNVGYGWANTNSDSFSIVTGLPTGTGGNDRNGILGGGQIGVNWMFAPQWLIGVEADIDAASLTGSSDNCGLGGGCAHTEVKTSWLGTARGRLGYAWDNLLLYGTGGAIWVHSTSDRTITVGGGGANGMVASSSGTHSGWTAGGGVEWGFAPKWSAKLEYLYYRNDASNQYIYAGFAGAGRRSESTNEGNIVRVGVNYHF